MKWIRTYETFVNDDNRGDEIKYPELNPVVKIEASEYVDSKLKSNEYMEIFNIVGVEPPSDINGGELDDIFDEVREKAIEYYTNNPEEIKTPITHKTFNVNGGDGVARTNNVGGSSHTNSRLVGENKQNLDTEIDITEDEMSLFKREELLIDLIRNGNVRISNKKVFFNKDDKDTLDTLDMYLEIDKNSLKSDN